MVPAVGASAKSDYVDALVADIPDAKVVLDAASIIAMKYDISFLFILRIVLTSLCQ
jgi:hypothetical protein